MIWSHVWTGPFSDPSDAGRVLAMRRVTAITLLAVGIAALGAGVTGFVLATPARLHCTRSTQACQWWKPPMFGRAHEVTLALPSLHDSRVEYSNDRAGMSTRWLVGTAGADLELGAPTDSSDQGEVYERTAHDLEHFLTHTQPATFDAEFAARDRHWYLVLALAGAFALAAGVYLIRAR